MAKRIVWSRQAQNDRIQILRYWIDHNRSNTYSTHLNLLIKEAVNILSHYPEIGKPTEIDGVKGKIVRDYCIYYEITEEELRVLTIWDTRQDPNSLKDRL